MGTLAQNLIKFRDVHGLSQQVLAEKANIPQSAISDIELGKRKNPGYQTVLKLAAALGVNVSELLEEPADDSIPQSSKQEPA